MAEKTGDEALLKGGLGGTDGDGKEATKPDASGGKGAPAKVVMVGGVEFPEELGGKLQTLVDGFSRENASLRAELEALKKPAKKESVKDDEAYDYETQLFVNPKEALARLRKEIKDEVRAEVQEHTKGVESRMATVNTEREFWKEFYNDYPELKDDDVVVKAVLQRDFAKMSTLKVEEAFKKIAEETKKILLRHGGEIKGPKAREVEATGNTRSEGKKPTEQEASASEMAGATLSSFIKQRREARRAGGKAA